MLPYRRRSSSRTPSDRLGRGRRDAADPLALGLAAGFGQPQVVAGLQPHLAQRIVGGNLLVVDAREVEQQRRQQARAVLASDAVDDDRTVRRLRNRRHRGRDVRAEALEEHEVHITRRRR